MSKKFSIKFVSDGHAFEAAESRLRRLKTVHPFKIGDIVDCLYTDGTYYEAEILNVPGMLVNMRYIQLFFT